MAELYIMIAEDDADDRFLMQKALEELGDPIRIDFVQNGVELVESLTEKTQSQPAKELPGFILLDLNMPKMDGREVLRILKADAAYRRIPVIIFSTTKNHLEVQRCYDLGANTYIVKPVNFEALVDTIRQIRTYWLQTATLAAGA